MDEGTLMGLAAVGFVFLLGMLLMGGESSSTKKRKIMVSGQKPKDSMFGFMKAEDSSATRRKQIEESLGDLEARNKDKEKVRKSLKSKLMQANWNTTPQTFLLISMGLGIAAAGATFIAGLPIWQIAGVGAIVGFGLPRWILNMAITTRQKKFTMYFADAMDIIVRGVRTGLPLGDCLKIIAHESPAPVGEEFARAVEAEAVGVPIETCLERMYDRIPIAEVKFFSTVLNIQRSTGGNLGEALANLSNVLRGRKILREKIKALSAEAKASAMIIGVLPPGVGILMTFVNPDYMSDLYGTDRGQQNLMIGAMMMFMGIMIMRKMINFKI